jgi:bla regulator protein BlaR1
MLAWMIYVVVVTLLLGAAALAAEHGARLCRAQSRWCWIVAIVASLLIPTFIASVSVRLPTIFSPTVPQKSIALREVTSARLSPLTWLGATAATTTAWRGIDPLLQRSWGAASAAMLVGLLVSGAQLFWRKRRWATGTVAGASVFLAPGVGPAVVGLIRPRIVVPRWLTDTPASQQAVVIAHEQSHLDAGDPQLLTVALCLLVFMPWNLPLWWQLRRLRYAIEVDCDRRVLKRGHDATGYGETLIAVSQRQSTYIGAVAAMAESKSFLEERITIMVRRRAKWWRVPAAAFGCASVGLVAVAAQVGPPDRGGPSLSERRQVDIDPSTLDGYAGYYKLDDNAVASITRDGRRIFTQLTGQPPVEIYPESATEFFMKIVDAQITFVPDAQGQTTALVLHQNGANIVMPRIDPWVAEQIRAATTAKVQGQMPTPGSEAALRRLIAGINAGKPDVAAMSPQLADAVRQQMPRLQAVMSNLGAVLSVEFRGVGNQGWDMFDVKHERGAVQWRIALSARGIVTGALVSAGP